MKNKDIGALIAQLLQLGWRVERTRKTHYRFLSPDASVKPIFTSGTPSDWRSFNNIKAELRRNGAKI